MVSVSAVLWILALVRWVACNEQVGAGADTPENTATTDEAAAIALNADTLVSAPGDSPKPVPLPEVLTDHNYTMLYNGSWIIQLYQSRRCLFSSELQSLWPNIINTGLQQDEGYRFANIDVWDNVVAATVLEVKALPTIKLIQNGKVFTYLGNSTQPSVMAFIANGTKTARWHNNLPRTYHIMSYFQLKAFVGIQSLQATIVDAICDYGGRGTPLCQ
ncbi:hypothetical protein BASA83_007837 [Batrachochytrium salamandrivorans]|nr:hypothetical protein BASA83_007837 [Batrachochytrium salamandrivorans]